MKAHVCEDWTKWKTCLCSPSIDLYEPSEDCPIHGCPWPPACHICGRFMKWEADKLDALDSEEE